MIRLFALLALLGLAGPLPAQAQQANLYCFSATAPTWQPCSAANALAVSASVSASITGFPTTQTTGTPISVTTGGVTGSLPTGTVVVASNVGTTNMAFCKLGASATTADQPIAPNGGWFAFTVGAATQLTCITSTSTTTVNTVGGSGLPTGSGGGGGGSGGGGAVTIASGAVASGAYSSGSIASGAYASGSISDGADVTQGAKGDAKSTATDTTAITIMQVLKEISFMEQTPASRAVTNAGTFAVQATLQASGSTAIGKVDPNTISTWGLAATSQNVAAPTNGQVVMGQFTTTPTTLSTTNVSPLQLDNAGNLLVNIKAGAGSGGTALADGGTFTEATTNFTPIGGEYVSGGGANCTTGKGCTLQMTIDRNAYVNVNKWAGTALGAMANYGTSPGAVAVPGVNAFVTNANANGQAIAANSSPVVAPVLTVAGAAVVKGGVPVVNGGSNYLEVAASQTATVLQTSTGATGDYLSHCVIYPATTGAGLVTVFDNTNSAANNVIQFVSGTLSNLAPIAVPVGANSVNGAWKVTTGANVAVVCYGKFS